MEIWASCAFRDGCLMFIFSKIFGGKVDWSVFFREIPKMTMEKIQPFGLMKII